MGRRKLTPRERVNTITSVTRWYGSPVRRGSARPEASVREAGALGGSRDGSVRTRRFLAALALVLASLLTWASPSEVVADADFVQVVTIDGAIDPLSARHLARGIDLAARDGAQLVIVALNTPGGLLSSTRDMVEALLRAKVPVAVYVSPPGAQAASAGTFITAAANFAVMAPGTNIGAASPVSAGGEDIPETLARKVNEDTRAFIRSIAEKRDRNAQALEDTVTRARSYSAGEAVEIEVVDFMAGDLRDLLEKVDGQTAETAAGPAVLRTEGAGVREIKPTLLNNFLGVLADPNLAFLLFVLGGIGVLVELISPGFIGPGVVGGIALALAFLGFGNLPVNWVAVGLLLFSMVLFYLETVQPGISVSGIGGVVCLVLGAVLLFGGRFSTPDIPEPSFLVSPWVIGAFGGAAVAAWVVFMRLVKSEGGSSSGYISASHAALEGEWGVAASDLAPSGKVMVNDEEWTATTDSGDVIREGEGVKVIGVYGDVLKVTPLYDEPELDDAK